MQKMNLVSDIYLSRYAEYSGQISITNKNMEKKNFYLTNETDDLSE